MDRRWLVPRAVVLLLPWVVVATARAQPIAGGGEAAQLATHSSGELPVTSDPALSPSTASAVAAFFTADSEGTLTSASVNPFRIAPHVEGLWGLQLRAAYDSEDLLLTAGASYRFDWPVLLASGLVSDADYNRIVAAGEERLALVMAHHVREKREAIDGSTSDAGAYCNHLATLQPWVQSFLPMVNRYPDSERREAAIVALNGVEQIAVTQHGLMNCTAQPPAAPTAPSTTQSEELLTGLQNALDALLALANVDIRRESRELTVAADRVSRDVLRCSHFSAAHLVPVLTLGYLAGVFPSVLDRVNSAMPMMPGPDWRTDASHSFQAQLFWHLGTYVEAQVESAYSIRRLAAVDDTATMMLNETGAADYFSGSWSIVGILAPLLGTDWYDGYYLEHRFQRGIGIGAFGSLEMCLEAGDDRALCAKNRTMRGVIGGLIDLRIATEARVRFRVGYQHVETYNTASATMQGNSGVDVAGTFVYTLE